MVCQSSSTSASSASKQVRTKAAAPAEQEGDAASLVYQHGKPLKDILFAVEEECLRQALQRCATMHEAAQMLGMHPTTLWRKLAQHNMGQEGKA